MKKKEHADIKAHFASLGFTLNGEYIEPKTVLALTCPSGHSISTSWKSFRKINQCVQCIGGVKKQSQGKIVREAFSRSGYKLLSERYERNTIRMDCICPENHQIKMDWASFQQGTRCGECSKTARGKTRRSNTAIKAETAFADAGYQMLDKYTDSHTPIKFICPEGHQHQMSWTNFDTGHRCTHCSKAAPVSHEDVQQSFESEGYKLLDRYKSKRKLRFICPQRHKWSMSWDSWNSGTRCAVCSGGVITRKQVRDAFDAEGYTLLTHYQNKNTQKLDFICPEGHSHSITWADFNSGYRCIFCSCRAPVDHGFVKEYFESNGYTLLGDYTDALSKIPYVCPEGHKYSITWNSFKQGCRCPQCQGKIVFHKDVAKAFALEGYQLLDEYKNSGTHMRYICPEGHQSSIVWDSFKAGNRCAYCAGQKPTQEERMLTALAKNISGLIIHYLRKQEVKKDFSATSFARKVATQINQVLGDRPEGYHLDHIIPQSFFDFRNKIELEACWDINNLRWLSAFENCSKGCKLTDDEVSSFSIKQVEILAIASRKPRRFEQVTENPKILLQLTLDFG